jgi:hypothetical protein
MRNIEFGLVDGLTKAPSPSCGSDERSCGRFSALRGIWDVIMGVLVSLKLISENREREGEG